MDAKLVVVGGEARLPEVDLKCPLTVGRGRSSGLALPHPLVSRQHCEIYEEEGKLVINDLGSLNGTFVGDQRINEPTFLMPGELLTIGTVTFRAVYELAGGNDGDFAEEESTSFEVPTGDRTVQLSNQTVSDMSDAPEIEVAAEIEEVVEVEEVATVDAEAEEAFDVEFAEVEEPDELEVVEEAEIAEPVDIAGTIHAPTEPKQARSKPVAKPTQPKSAGSRPAAPRPKAAVADLEVVEELEEVEFAAEEEVVAVEEEESSSTAGHDTKEVSPASGDTESADGDADDLDSFLQGLG